MNIWHLNLLFWSCFMHPGKKLYLSLGMFSSFQQFNITGAATVSGWSRNTWLPRPKWRKLASRANWLLWTPPKTLHSARDSTFVATQPSSTSRRASSSSTYRSVRKCLSSSSWRIRKSHRRLLHRRKRGAKSPLKWFTWTTATSSPPSRKPDTHSSCSTPPGPFFFCFSLRCFKSFIHFGELQVRSL